MPQPDRNPLAATRRLLVDGTNLLYALSKTSTAAPPAALIGRLRGAIPAATTIELVFDGPPERGLRNERIAAGVDRPLQRRRGPPTTVILLMIDDVRSLDGADGTATLLVVTDDRELRHGARLRGARTAGSAWLLGRLGAGRLVVAVGRQSATGAHLAADAVRSGAVVLAGPVERRRPGRDGPSQVEDRTRRDDQTRQPQAGSQGGWDW